MKKSIAFAILTILIGLSLTFTQVLAAGPGLPAKKTPGAGKPGVEQPDKNKDKKETKQVEKTKRKETKQVEKPEKSKTPKKSKTPHPSKTPKAVEGKRVNFRGKIDSLGADSLDVELKSGRVETIDMDSGTRVHIPTQGGSTAQGLQTGMEVSVHAIIRPQGGNPLATSINAIPGAPARVHRVGMVTGYVPGASITIIGKDGQPVTIDISGATILPRADAEIVIGASRVTIISPRDVPGGTLAARAVVVHPLKK